MNPIAICRRSQRGYSLVEVMVAITIALFLMGGALTVLQHTRSTYQAQSQLALLQDNERMAMQLMTDVIQSAGYYPNPHQFTDVLTLVASPSLPAGTPNIGIAAPAVTGAQGDTIAVRYATAPGDNVFNCRGDQYTGTALFETWESAFSVVPIIPAPPPGSPQFQLQCTLWSGSTGASATFPLVTGVNSLTITYGVNTVGTGTGSCVDRYKSSQNMAAADWANICSVKVQLTFPNPFNPKGGTKPTISFERIIAVMGTAGANTVPGAGGGGAGA